jgi:chromosome partitioning protein
MIMTVASEKGGVGKTTVAANLAALHAKTAPTLLIDLDPQGAATAAFNQVANQDLSVGDLLLNPSAGTIDDALVNVGHGLVLMPAWRPSLDHAASALILEPGGDRALSRILDSHHLTERFAAIYIDTPANLGRLTLTAVCASTHVLGVVNSEPWSAGGAATVAAWVSRLREEQQLTQAEFVGLVNNKHTPNRVLTQVVDAELQNLPVRVLSSTIPLRQQVADAALLGEPTTWNAPTSLAGEAFAALFAELSILTQPDATFGQVVDLRDPVKEAL